MMPGGRLNRSPMVLSEMNDMSPRRKFLRVKSSFVLMYGPQDEILVISNAGQSLIICCGSRSASSQNVRVVGKEKPMCVMCTGKTLCPVIHCTTMCAMCFGCDINIF